MFGLDISSNSSFQRTCMYTCVRWFINLEISLGGVCKHWTLSLREDDTPHLAGRKQVFTNEQSSFIYMYIPLLTNPANETKPLF